jgi:hypothetical protein
MNPLIHPLAQYQENERNSKRGNDSKTLNQLDVKMKMNFVFWKYPRMSGLRVIDTILNVVSDYWSLCC